MTPRSPIADREKDVQSKIRQLAAIYGFHVSDFSQPRATKQTEGIPDLHLAHPARQFRVWIEVKKAGGTLSPAQKAWHKAVGAAGGRIWVCESLGEFQAYLEAYGFGGRT